MQRGHEPKLVPSPYVQRSLGRHDHGGVGELGGLLPPHVYSG